MKLRLFEGFINYQTIANLTDTETRF